MTVLPRLAALGVALLLAGCSSSGDDPAAAPSPTAPALTAPSPGPSLAGAAATYLALGDSVAAGTGADDPARGGYVPVLAALLQDRCEDDAAAGCPVRLRNLSVPGATTVSLLRHQLPPALEALRGGGVRTVTVTVGGNDVFVPVLRACAQTPGSAACVEAVREAVAGVDRGVDQLLAALSTAGGAATTLAVMTYYDPLAACRLAPLRPLAQQVLEGRAGEDGLNDVLRARAEEHGAVVVETAGRLAAPQDFVGGLDCLHPSASGHQRIAAAFAEALAAP